MKAQQLRKKYPEFVYESYSYGISKNNLEILFSFKIPPNIAFQPRIIIRNVNKTNLKKLGKETLDNLVFNLGLIEMLSYWKATCSPKIMVKAGFLDKAQINWWKNLIIRGMGQFFYENEINFRKPGFLEIIVPDKRSLAFRAKGMVKGLRNEYLVPVGGGKDSTVTIESLKKAAKIINCFSLNPTKATLGIMKIAGCKKPITAERKIDKGLLELNRKGYLNGHTPFSAYLAFLSFLTAAISGQKYIALSNERSSNEGNVKYLGKTVNHQWSKSFEFENEFRKYSKKYLTGNIEYFSFLRPLYEIQIAKIFSRYPQYFSSFLSCNEAYKTASGTKEPTGRWCGNCSKCLFVYAILYPFLKEKQLLKIFKRNVFENRELLSTMQQLTGEKGFKPFECVGTKKESLAAFYLSLDKKLPLPFLLRHFKTRTALRHKNLGKESRNILDLWNNQNNLPKELIKILKKEISKKS
jgi:hypothetical protein